MNDHQDHQDHQDGLDGAVREAIALLQKLRNKKRIGEREVTEAVLKMVSGGAMSEGGTSSNTADIDA